VRRDAAHDGEETHAACLDEQVAFICRWNPSKTDPWQVWRSLGEDPPHFASGPGYFTALLDERHELADGRSVRRIVLVTRKTGAGEQLLLVPEYELEGYWTSLELPPEEVIDVLRRRLFHRAACPPGRFQRGDRARSVA